MRARPLFSSFQFNETAEPRNGDLSPVSIRRTRVIKDADRKVFLILDNLRAHHSKWVKAWVQERRDQIELFYLPSYSPELNPEERLNADLKREMGKRVPIRTKARLRAAANDHMAMTERSPERVIAYFQDRNVRYAA